MNIKYEVGTKVKVKNDIPNYQFNAGKIKTITKLLPDFEKSKAFVLDNDTGIWCIEDFDTSYNSTQETYIEAMAKKYSMSKTATKNFKRNLIKERGDDTPFSYDLDSCFVWECTPEKWKYWNNIDKRINN